MQIDFDQKNLLHRIPSVQKRIYMHIINNINNKNCRKKNTTKKKNMQRIELGSEHLHLCAFSMSFREHRYYAIDFYLLNFEIFPHIALLLGCISQGDDSPECFDFHKHTHTHAHIKLIIWMNHPFEFSARKSTNFHMQIFLYQQFHSLRLHLRQIFHWFNHHLISCLHKFVHRIEGFDVI